MSMIYLASPYWHPDPLIRAKRVDLSLAYLVSHLQRWRNNRDVPFMVAPLTYTNEVKRFLPKWSNQDWIELTDRMLVEVGKAGGEMHWLELPEWENSSGLSSEFRRADELSMKVKMISWPEIHDRFTRPAQHLLNLHRSWDESEERENG